MTEPFPPRTALFSLAILSATFLVQGAEESTGKPALLVLAHGSPSTAWNQPVLDLGARIAQSALETGRFGAVRTAMMEFGKPAIPAAVAELEASGCSRIIAVPLFVMPTDHTHFDLPAVLGLYSSARKGAHAEEHSGITCSRIPITLTETMSGDNRLLPEYALAEVKKLSKSPSGEAIVLLAHGAPTHELLCDQVMRRIAAYCCGKTGIQYADWAYIGVGQGFQSEGVPAIRRAAEAKDRVLVVGLYLAAHAQLIRDRAVKADSHTYGQETMDISGKEVLFSNEAIVASPHVVDWVLDSARRTADTFEK